MVWVCHPLAAAKCDSWDPQTPNSPPTSTRSSDDLSRPLSSTRRPLPAALARANTQPWNGGPSSCRRVPGFGFTSPATAGPGPARSSLSRRAVGSGCGSATRLRGLKGGGPSPSVSSNHTSTATSSTPIAIVAKHKRAAASSECWIVANAIAGPEGGRNSNAIVRTVATRLPGDRCQESRIHRSRRQQTFDCCIHLQRIVESHGRK